MISRRSFLSRLLPAAAGVIVAPTLAETLLCSSKKYFFLRQNPLADDFLRKSLYAQGTWEPIDNGDWSGAWLHTLTIEGKVIHRHVVDRCPFAMLRRPLERPPVYDWVGGQDSLSGHLPIHSTPWLTRSQEKSIDEIKALFPLRS